MRWEKIQIKILTQRYDQWDQYAMRVGAPSFKKPCKLNAEEGLELFGNFQYAAWQGAGRNLRRLRPKKNRPGLFSFPAELRFQCSSEV
jgi:hypothetical protein